MQKHFIRLGLAAAWMLAGGVVAQAQDYPNKPIRLLVPYATGGSTDLTGRIYGEALQRSLGQNIVVENRPGAAGTIGIDVVAKAKADGYTLGVSGVGPTAIVPLIDSKTPYQPLRDLDIVAGLSIVDAVFVALPNSKYKSMKEVLDDAKAHPDTVSFGTSGVAGPVHLDMENLSQLAKVKMIHVPFQGDTPAITAVLSGDVAIAAVSAASATSFLASGKLKGLAAGGPGRLKLLPDLTTVAEQTGFKDYEMNTWNVLVSARGTPPEIIARLNKAVNEAAANPATKEKLENLGLKVMPGDVKWVQEFVNSKIERNRKLIETTGLKRE
ncbi:MAG: tripartite tricarboxylate transporter substrate binding protein [Xanthobacteraceae bacterium]